MRTANPELIEKAIKIGRLIEERRQFFDKKTDRARSQKSHDSHYEKLKLYRSFSNRAFHLIFALRYPKQFGIKEKYSILPTAEQYKKQEAERIETGKDKFLNKHTYSPWFFVTGLHLDYGQYTCSKCNRIFFHSPSRIRKAGKVLYNCACGYCTNEIIERDWDATPYE